MSFVGLHSCVKMCIEGRFGGSKICLGSFKCLVLKYN
jgi:hypothetical protein